MILPIYTYGQPVLRKVAEDIDADYPELKELIQNMFETNDRAEGVGLAAPQIGLPIRVVIVDLTPLAEAKNIEINSSYCESLYIMANNDKLWQGIYNIIDNAIKYTPTGGRVVIGITKSENNAIIAVKDNGIGIGEDDGGSRLHRAGIIYQV